MRSSCQSFPFARERTIPCTTGICSAVHCNHSLGCASIGGGGGGGKAWEGVGQQSRCTLGWNCVVIEDGHVLSVQDERNGEPPKEA